MTTPAFTTLRVPERLGPAGVRSLREAIAGLSEDGVLVLRGETARCFCAGLDLAGLGTLDPTSLRAGLEDYASLLRALAEAPVPVLAVVEGEAFGGGVGIAAAADLVVATPESRFGLPESRHGFYPAIVFAALDLRLAAQRSRRLALQCESIDAREASAIGLADVVVTPDAIDATVARWGRKLRRPTPGAIRAMRAHAPHRDRFRDALAAGVDATERALSDPTVRAAIEEAIR